MTDIEKLEFFYAHTVAQIGAALTLFAGALVCAFLVMPVAGVVMLGGAAAVALTAGAGAGPARRIGAREQREREEQSERLVDALGALREILAYGLQDRVVREAVAGTRRSARISRRREAIAHLVDGMRELILTAVVIGVIAATLALDGTVGGTQAALLPAVIALAVAGVAAVADAAHTVSELHPLIASAARVGAGLDRPPVVSPIDRPLPLPDGPLGVRFEKVSFSYDDRTEVLHGWSIDVDPGEHVGLAGRPEQGKSTVIALAARLWDPLRARSRSSMPRVSRTPSAASVTTISAGPWPWWSRMRDSSTAPCATTSRAAPTHRTDEELRRALTRVGADGWITLDDDLGEHGVRLSGGQRARLALARALCREPRVLIVDEITASLDAESERIISDVLEDFDGTVIAASTGGRRWEIRTGGRSVEREGVEREEAAATAGPLR